MKRLSALIGMVTLLWLGLLTLSGCYFADRPLSSVAAKDERLEGIWYLQSMPGHEENEAQEGPFHHLTITAKGSLYRIEMFNTPEDTHPEVYTVQLTREGDLEAMNVLISPKTDSETFYQFFPYEIETGGEQDKLILYEFPDETLTTAIKQGTLRGVIESDKSVRLIDTEAALREFVRTTTEPPARKPYMVLLKEVGC